MQSKDTTAYKGQRIHLPPAPKCSPPTSPSELQIESSLLSPDWLDSSKSLFSVGTSPHSPAHSLMSDFLDTTPTSSSPSDLPSALPVPPGPMRSISSQTSSSSPYYGRLSIEKHLADTMLLSTERSNQYMTNARGIATSIPPSSKSTPTNRQGQKRPVAQSNKQFMQISEAEAHVQKGIRYHEGGQLEKATQHFRVAADRDSPMGMFLYGISLRHGWVSSVQMCHVPLSQLYLLRNRDVEQTLNWHFNIFKKLLSTQWTTWTTCQLSTCRQQRASLWWPYTN